MHTPSLNEKVVALVKLIDSADAVKNAELYDAPSSIDVATLLGDIEAVKSMLSV